MQLDSSGYFVDENGERFIPFGANYWPGSCGVEMWRAWPEDEILSDLDLMASLGFNSVRFFVRWPDFEPVAGEYDETAFARLERFLSACVQRGLRPQPSFFVGWMSGGLFWPDWKGSRNLFSDAFMIERAACYARKVSECLKPYAGQLCGVDLGNELNALPESTAASPAHVREWCRRMTDAIHAVLPETIILSGCDHQQLTADSGWRLGTDTQPGIGVFTMHGYPVPGWHPVSLRGLGDALTTSLLPFYVKCARAFGPVMLQEFGPILGSSAAAPQTESYLRTMLVACWNAGANGFLWWCFKDISAQVHPYLKHAFESELGLVNAEGKVKKGMAYYVDFARAVISGELGVPPSEKSSVALYFPKHYYDRENPQNPGNVPRELIARLLIAHHLLGLNGIDARVVRGDQPVPAGVRCLIVTCARLDADEIEALQDWVSRQGGHVIWHGPDPMCWNAKTAHVLGASIADYASGYPVEGDVADARYKFTRFPRDIRVKVALKEADCLATDNSAQPLVFQRMLGSGLVTVALADIEGCILEQWEQHDCIEHWQMWYLAMIGCGGIVQRDSHGDSVPAVPASILSGARLQLWPCSGG